MKDKYIDPGTRRFRANTDSHIDPAFSRVGWNELTELAYDWENTAANDELRKRLDFALGQSTLYQAADRQQFDAEQRQWRRKFDRNTVLIQIGVWVVMLAAMVAGLAWLGVNL